MDPDPGGPKTYGSDGSGFGSATLVPCAQNKGSLKDFSPTEYLVTVVHFVPED
jgi:hypothetical protein